MSLLSFLRNGRCRACGDKEGDFITRIRSATQELKNALDNRSTGIKPLHVFKQQLTLEEIASLPITTFVAKVDPETGKYNGIGAHFIQRKQWLIMLPHILSVNLHANVVNLAAAGMEICPRGHYRYTHVSNFLCLRRHGGNYNISDILVQFVSDSANLGDKDTILVRAAQEYFRKWG